MTKRRILVVDDDAGVLLPLFEQWEKVLAAEYRIATSLGEGLSQIHEGTDFTGALFDLILPVGPLPATLVSSLELRASVQKQGGLLLAAVFQKRFPGRPMVIWSFAPEPRAELEPFINAGVCCFFSKNNINMIKTADYMTEFLGQDAKPRRVVTQIWKSLLLQPNFAGLGIDLKALFEKLKTK